MGLRETSAEMGKHDAPTETRESRSVKIIACNLFLNL